MPCQAAHLDRMGTTVIVLRILGLIFLIIATVFLGWEAVRSGGDDGWQITKVGKLWYWIDPPSLGLLEAGIVRHVSEDFWYDVVFPILELPVWALLGALGLILLAVSFLVRRRRRRLFRKA
jgi:hypothetical protein